MATLADIQQRIETVRGKERNVILVSGLCQVIVTLVLVVLGYFMLDFLFDLPYGARWLFALGGLSIVGYIFHRALILELAKIHDDDEIALRIESRNSDLRGRLISTLQLTRANPGPHFIGSPELIQALELETVRMSEPLDFGKIINTTLLKRLSIAAILVLAVNGALIVTFPDYFAALGVRLLNADARFPTKTRVKSIVLQRADGTSGDAIPRGEELRVIVEIDETSFVPKEPGVLYFKTLGKDLTVPIELTPMGGTTFKGVLSKALESMELTVRVNDYRSEPQTIRVLGRPEVDVGASGEAISYTFPAYTGEKSVPKEKFGGLTALTGSTATIRFVSTKPLTSATLLRDDAQKFEFKKSVEMKKEKVGEKEVETQVEWWTLDTLSMDKSGSFHMALVDTDGLTNSQPPVEYPIDARLDAPPSVKLHKPSRDATVTPVARINVQFSARDDWGLRCLWLVYRIQKDGDQEGAGKVERVERKLDGKKDIQPTVFQWDLATLSVKPGDQVVFWLEADDECTTNDNVGARTRRTSDGQTVDAAAKLYSRSIDVKLTVISKEEKALELQAEVERLYQQLVTAKENQEELKMKLRILLEEIQKLKAP